MKTSVIETRDMLSVLGVEELEKRIGEVPGVESVTVNFAARNATVRYDETRIDIAEIKSAVRQRGYESVAPEPTPVEPTAVPAPTAAVPKPSPDAAAATPGSHSAAGQHEETAPDNAHA